MVITLLLIAPNTGATVYGQELEDNPASISPTIEMPKRCGGQ